MMSRYHIGTLSKGALYILKDESREDQGQTSGDVFLEPRFWKKAELCDKKSVSCDTKIFTFKLQHDKQILGLPTGQHLMMVVKDFSSAGKSIIRAYTPISQTDQQGFVELLVKMYYPTVALEGGKMTMALDRLPIGSTVEFKGPIGKFTYLGKGRVAVNGKAHQVSAFRTICGGSGITPIFQVVRAVMQDPEDTTTCVVIDGNRMEEDILCRAELDAFAASTDLKCTVVHTLTKASSTWTGHRGRVSEQLLREYAPPGKRSMALICGPAPMERSVHQILLAQGWKESDLVFF
jgi:nitrate reductase (NAD(P)H)